MTAPAGCSIGYNNPTRAATRVAMSHAAALKEGPMLEEFRKFALKGNVVDLAIGVIIGAAFGRIVESVVGDMIMPAIGALGGLDFSNYFIPLSKSVTATALADAKKQGPVLAWGNFVTVVINFLIIAWVLFIAVRGMNRLRLHEEAKPAPPPPQEVLLTEIRDLLAKKQGE
jgi:large conductance mechanosensitive channel